MRVLHKLIFLILIICYSNSVFATTLLDVYQQAFLNNATYLQTLTQNQINNEKVIQARSNLLPTLSATFNHTNNQIVPMVITQFSPVITHYQANGFTLQFTQPLINFNRWYALRSNAQIAHANPLLLKAAKQNLMISVAQAYFNILQDQEILASAQINKKVYAKELEQAKLKFDAGLILSPAVYQAQTAVDIATSQIVTAQINLQNDLINLLSITGKNYLNADFQIPELKLTSSLPRLTLLINTAEKTNPLLLAARNSITAAKINIEAINANHFPIINLVGAYTKNYQPNFIVGANQLANAGVQLTLPIFQGGYVNSTTREAKDAHQIAIEKFDLLYYQTITTVQQQYNNILNGRFQIKACAQAVNAANHALISTQISYKIGDNSFVDVLSAEQALFQAKINYTENKYHYLLSILLLKQALGMLNENDLD